MDPIRFVIHDLLAQGAYLLAGPPKKGKSWMALQICLAVAGGIPLWGFPVTAGDVLYLCLEDSLNRIQSRLFDLTDDAPAIIHFATISERIGHGLEQQIEDFVSHHPNTVLVVIDTLQKVRPGQGDNAYASDYDDAGAVKSLADRLGLCILMVHHTRKQYDSDPMNRISGTSGMPGAVDGYFVLESRPGGDEALLHCNGWDIDSRALLLSFDRESHLWTLQADSVKQPERFLEDILLTVRLFWETHGFFHGTPDELAAAMQPWSREKLLPSPLSKKLLQSTGELSRIGIRYESKKSNGKRMVTLSAWSGGSVASDVRGDISHSATLPSLN